MAMITTGMTRIMRMIMLDKKVAWAEATVIVLASIFGVVRIVTAIPRVRKILVKAKGLGYMQLQEHVIVTCRSQDQFCCCLCRIIGEMLKFGGYLYWFVHNS